MGPLFFSFFSLLKMRTDRLFLLSALLLASAGGTVTLAQNPVTGGPTPTAAPTAIPLDGGASLLLAAGAAYGLKRLRRKPRQ